MAAVNNGSHGGGGGREGRGESSSYGSRKQVVVERGSLCWGFVGEDSTVVPEELISWQNTRMVLVGKVEWN